MREMTWKKLFYLVIMSSTRAALRRNEVKSNTPAPSIPPRGGSIPSIQGSNSFNQQVAMRQQQQPNQPRHNQMNQPQRQSQPNGQKPVQKQQLTIEQAITLITLRLGRLEVGFQQFDSHESNGSMNEDLAQNILTRLETLEENDNDNTNNNNNNRLDQDTTEITMLKQQMETMKQFMTKSFKTVNTTISSFKNEITDLRKSLQSLEKISIENNAQLMVLSMNANANAMDDDEADDLVADADEETADVAVSVTDEETDGVINDIDETQPGVLVEDEPDNENA